MDILFVTTELAPYAKVGGLADVAQALPKALRAIGHKVTILLPRYPSIEEGGLLVARRLTPMRLAHGDRTIDVTVYDGRLSSQVDIVLVDVGDAFARPGIYGENGVDYADNAERFALLSRAAVELARTRAAEGAPFDVIHANDWPTALVAPLVRKAELAAKTVLTLHNAAHQGRFDASVLVHAGLEGAKLAGVRGSEASYLEMGIGAADAVTTVSATYAEEIASEAMGFGLDGAIRARGGVVGILNGVDYGVWNPATDVHLSARYDAEGVDKKSVCRGALQKELGLALDGSGPMIASVGRLVAQKGSDLLAEAIPAILRGSDAQIVVCGEGDEAIASQLRDAAEKSGGRCVFTGHAAEGLVHRVFAGADLVLVPSRYEPCGLVQMYAQRYGAAPVARATGGLVDTVVDCDAQLETGTGFLFHEATADALVAAVQRAVAATTQPRWAALRRRIMKIDRSWDRPARQYEGLYSRLVRQG